MLTNRLVGHHLRLRPWAFALSAAISVSLVLSAAWTVPNVQGDPTIPRTRVAVVLGCALASSVLLFVRPILPEPERLAGRGLRVERLLLYSFALGGPLGVGGIIGSLTAQPVAAFDCLSLGAALTGLGLCAGTLGIYPGLVATPLYVVAGLSFGYTHALGGPGSLKPWAWLVDGNSAGLAEGALAVVCVLVAGILGVRSRSRID